MLNYRNPFPKIYWAGYLALLLAILVPYYVFVLLKYFRKEVLGLARWASAQQKKEIDAIDEETDEDVPGLRVAYQAGNMEREDADMGTTEEIGTTAGSLESGSCQRKGSGVFSR
ncbi:MAG TPA: hypothetical protein VGN00_11800 [Puia sp.]|jgi:hypothetical protein